MVPRIVVAFHSTGTCITQFALDLAKAMRYSGTQVPLALHEQSCYVDSARNKLVKAFLSIPPHEATHLMMVDVDISFSADAFIRTFQILDTHAADVVYANYALGNCANSIFGPAENKAKEAAVLANLRPGMLYGDIGTGGTGWLMATRKVLERMQAECPGPWHWFARDPTADGSDLRGEDVSFGLRLWEMNPRPKVIATTHLLLRHYKTHPVVPDFMAPMAAAEKVPAFAMPNPYEHDPANYLVRGNLVLHKKYMKPEDIVQLEAEIAKEKEDALGRSHEQVQEGGTTVRLEEGQKGALTQTSNSDNAEREASS